MKKLLLKKPLFAGAIIFALALAWCCLQFFRAPPQIVEVLRGDTVIATINLASQNEPKTLRFDSPDGGFNELLFENGTVRVLRSDCRGQECVKMGRLRSASLPIVCIPHRLTVRFARGGELDSVAQ